MTENEVISRAIRECRHHGIDHILKNHPVGNHVSFGSFITKMEHNGVEINDERLSEYVRITGIDLARVTNKINSWLEAFRNGRWCRKCGLRPTKKNHRMLCSKCHGKPTSGFEPLGSGSSQINGPRHVAASNKKGLKG